MISPLLTTGFLGNFGMPELIFIFVIVLIIFGPKSLPSLGRAMGKGLREFKDASSKFSEAIQDVDDEPAKPARSDRAQIESREPRQPVAPPAPPDTVSSTPKVAPSEREA